MPTRPKLLTRTLWPRLSELARRPGRIWAAVPYFSSGGAKRLPLKKGDVLVTRFDDATIKAGMTDPREILTLIKRGVVVHAHANLHAKVYAFEDVAIVGSANVSSFSERYLVEAAIETREPSTVGACRNWVESLVGDVVEPSFAASKIAIYRTPRIPGFVAGRKTRRRSSTASQSALWVVRLVTTYWSEADYSAEGEALHEGATRISDADRYRQDTFSLVGTPLFDSMKKDQRVLQLTRDGSKHVMASAPGRILSIRPYRDGNANCAMVSLEVRKHARAKRLVDLIDQLGPAAETLRQVKARRLLKNRDLVRSLGLRWPKA